MSILRLEFQGNLFHNAQNMDIFPYSRGDLIVIFKHLFLLAAFVIMTIVSIT